MAKKSLNEDALNTMVYGEGEDPQTDPQNPVTDPQEEEPVTDPVTDPSTGEGDDPLTPEEPETDSSSPYVAGPAQASNMQTTTTVGSKIPQVDTSKYEVRSRFAANGKNAGANSDFAIKATSEGAGFKPTKDVKKNAFPEDGSTYKEIVNTNSY